MGIRMKKYFKIYYDPTDNKTDKNGTLSLSQDSSEYSRDSQISLLYAHQGEKKK